MADSTYSPRLRTAVVLCGAGTAGAYQAGALRALAEAGVKVDLLAAHGAGVAAALAAAIDGGSRFWQPTGPWAQPRIRRAYRFRMPIRIAAWGLALGCLAVLSPLLILVAATIVYVLSAITALVGLSSLSASLVAGYQNLLGYLFTPPVLPTIVPRITLLAILVVLGVLAVAAWQTVRHERSRRRLRGAFWWRLIGAPLESHEPAAALVDALWGLVRGASPVPTPTPEELGRRYVEIVADNFGQPGFREVLIGVHDLDARRDLVGALLPAAWQESFMARRKDAGPREAEIVDFTAAAQRGLVVDFLSGAMRLPVASPPHLVQFPADSYWRGETHRLCDRPELAARLIDEIAAVGIEQVILIGAAAPAAVPHTMRARPIDFRGKMGELLRSIETSALQDACAAAATRFSGVFAIRPDHNPIGPFDFEGVYDESSDRRRTLPELLQQGYDDAYRQFIEPTVATGDLVEV